MQFLLRVSQPIRFYVFSELKARLRSQAVRVVFVVDEVALGQGFLRVLWFLLSLLFYHYSILIKLSVTSAT